MDKTLIENEIKMLRKMASRSKVKEEAQKCLQAANFLVYYMTIAKTLGNKLIQDEQTQLN